MKTIDQLSDDQHPSIQQKAQQLTTGLVKPMDKLEQIFLFGFPQNGMR